MKIKILLLYSFILGVLSFSFLEKFYGFEYEDSFINSAVATSDNYFDRIENFRTSEYSSNVNNKHFDKKMYPGHYMSYSFFLKMIYTIFPLPVYVLHKIGNLILLILSITTLLFYDKKNRNIIIILILALFSSLPFFYVINSSLIENLSFFVGIITIVAIRNSNLNKSDINIKMACIFLITILTIVKRENLIYLILTSLFIQKEDFKNFKIYLSILFFVVIQIIVNPFFTEGIESKALNKPTFDINYLLFQLPTYLKSLFSIEGTVLLTLLLFFIKFNKKSLYFLFVWISFIILYSFHYRSKYAIISEQITTFDTYRYLVNTLPIFIGIIVFSNTRELLGKRKLFTISSYGFFLTCVFINTIVNFNYFKTEEFFNYHQVNELLIKENKNQKITVYDNFVLISILNFRNHKIDIKELNETVKIPEKENVFIINRFDEVDLKKNNGQLVKDNELSTSQTLVYKLKK